MIITKINPNKFNLEELEPAVATLKQGGVLVYPTETVYGLGANVYNEKAVQKIYHLKKRESKKPLSVMIAAIADAKQLCDELNETGEKLMKMFWPGPLTLIFKASAQVPIYIMSPDHKIGLRMPAHPITDGLMKLHREPVTSTSANFSGARPPVLAQEVAQNFENSVDLIIDGGKCSVQVPSTVVDVSGKETKIIREGAISKNKIMQCLHGV